MARSSFGSIRRLPSGRYQARYQLDGTGASRAAPTTFTTRAEASSWLARERVRLEASLSSSPRATRARAPKLLDYCETWLNDRPLRPSTRQTYRRYLDLHILPVLGPLRLDEITPATVRAWHQALAPKAPTVRARTYATLKTILGTAVSDEFIDANPCRIRGASQARPATDVVILEPTEVAALAAEMPERYRLAIFLGAYCQLRVGEALALRRRDIDLKAGRISVTRGVTWVEGEPLFGPPKTRAGVRSVALPSNVEQALTAHLRTIGRAGDALLFEGGIRDGWPPRLQTFADVVKRAAHRAGLPSTFRYHHLRHSGLTLLASAGASVAELQARAGHSTPHMALRYQHAREQRDRDLATRLADLVKESS